MARAAKTATKRRAASAARSVWLPLAISGITLALLVGSVVGAYQYLSQPGRMPLRIIEVNGSFRHLDRTAISATANAAIDGGFFSCDMPKLRSAVLDMPWVADVSVRRVWPDKLSMQVKEQAPIARWGERSLVTGDAVVFTPSNIDGYRDSVLLGGPDGSARRVVGFYEAALPAARERALTIVEIELDQRRHWWVRFDNGLTLSLGSEDRDERLAQFLRVYPRLVADPAKRPIRVDMRYAHGFAVRWQETTTDGSVAETPNPQDKV